MNLCFSHNKPSIHWLPSLLEEMGKLLTKDRIQIYRSNVREESHIS